MLPLVSLVCTAAASCRVPAPLAVVRTPAAAARSVPAPLAAAGGSAAAAARSVPAPLAAAGSAAAASSGVSVPRLGMLISPRDEALAARFLHEAGAVASR